MCVLKVRVTRKPYRKRNQLDLVKILSLKYTQRNLFEILLNQTEIRLYLPFYRFICNQTDARFIPNQPIPNQSINPGFDTFEIYFKMYTAIKYFHVYSDKDSSLSCTATKMLWFANMFIVNDAPIVSFSNQFLVLIIKYSFQISIIVLITYIR